MIGGDYSKMLLERWRQEKPHWSMDLLGNKCLMQLFIRRKSFLKKDELMLYPYPGRGVQGSKLLFKCG